MRRRKYGMYCYEKTLTEGKHNVSSLQTVVDGVGVGGKSTVRRVLSGIGKAHFTCRACVCVCVCVCAGGNGTTLIHTFVAYLYGGIQSNMSQWATQDTYHVRPHKK